MKKCLARLFTDIFRKREKKFASKLLYDEYHTMERNHDTTTTASTTKGTKDDEAGSSGQAANPLMNKLQKALFP